MANQKVLISGGTGMIGKKLTALLQEKGYTVSHLSRSKGNSSPNVKVIVWNIKNQELSSKEIEGHDYIIHLAGAGIFDKNWTKDRKQEIIASRVASANLLYKAISKCKQKPKAIISASAVGYYGAVTKDKIFTEEDPAGNDFLANTCRQWEDSITQFKKLGLRTVKLRQGMVIAKNDEVIKKMELPIKLGVGSALGTGKQYMPWIHIEDVCRMYLHTFEQEHLNGSFNAVAPELINNKEFTKEIADTLHRPLFLPNVPAFMLKLIFGEKSIMILEGSKISSSKIMDNGFNFKYPTLIKALKQIYKKSSRNSIH